MIGPTLPPHLQQTKPQKEDEEHEEDAYGPTLPPALAARRLQGHTLPSPPRRLVVDEASSDEEEIGPQPPVASTSRGADEDGVREFLEREQRRKELAEVCFLVHVAVD